MTNKIAFHPGSNLRHRQALRSVGSPAPGAYSPVTFTTVPEVPVPEPASEDTVKNWTAIRLLTVYPVPQFLAGHRVFSPDQTCASARTMTNRQVQIVGSVAVVGPKCDRSMFLVSSQSVVAKGSSAALRVSDAEPGSPLRIELALTEERL